MVFWCKNTHRPDKYTSTAIIGAYHLEAISHHSAPNWTVCLLHFHFPLSALSARLRARPEKWRFLRLIEHPQAQTKLTELHTRATCGCLDSLLLLCALYKYRRRERLTGTDLGSLFTLIVFLINAGCENHNYILYYKKTTHVLPPPPSLFARLTKGQYFSFLRKTVSM